MESVESVDCAESTFPASVVGAALEEEHAGPPIAATAVKVTKTASLEDDDMGCTLDSRSDYLGYATFNEPCLIVTS